MEILKRHFVRLLEQTDMKFTRYLSSKINWNERLIAVTGARGTGKTTLILQHIKSSGFSMDEVLYASLDHVYFAKHGLLETAENFMATGGKYLFLDEVHKYPAWSAEIKNIYDIFPELHIVLSGSSALNIKKGRSDLSRRMVEKRLQGLSFREFLALKYAFHFPSVSLEELLENKSEIARNITAQIKPLKYFKEYLKEGYYPFFVQPGGYYLEKVLQALNEVLETDLPAVTGIRFSSIVKLKKLLTIISDTVPYMPQLTTLSREIGVDRETLLKYLYHLQAADLVMILHQNKQGSAAMRKPEKIYLNNTNLMTALAEKSVDTGTMRETFFFNQIQLAHQVHKAKKADFIIDNEWVFEIGGKNKDAKQIKGIEKAFLALDDIEIPYANRIPLWMFGFLY